jgi:mannose/fructose/N-acetylgalactosamine-specific phosphotransferase system component IID
MSEFKGQLLSMILVLAIFSAISGALVVTFKKAAEKVGQEVTVDTNGNVNTVSSVTEKQGMKVVIR